MIENYKMNAIHYVAIWSVYDMEMSWITEVKFISLTKFNF